MGGLAEDDDEAVRLYELGAAQGEKYSQKYLGFAYNQGLGPLTANLPAALQFFERAARQGYDVAQFNVGTLYYNGDGGVARDDKLALVWYQLAANGGDVDAKVWVQRARSRCTNVMAFEKRNCLNDAEAMINAFVVQDACTASLFDRTNFCSGRGTPTPE